MENGKRKIHERTNVKGARIPIGKFAYQFSVCFEICLFKHIAKDWPYEHIWLNSCYWNLTLWIQMQCLLVICVCMCVYIIRSIYTLRCFAQFTLIWKPTKRSNNRKFVFFLCKIKNQHLNEIQCIAKTLLVQIKRICECEQERNRGEWDTQSYFGSHQCP